MKRTIIICGLILANLGPSILTAQPIDEVSVTGRRLSESLSTSVYSSTMLGRSDLEGAALGLDDTLRRVPGFGLFRRQASRAAHPTTQGVSLRGLGPNGAGRTLVLLDGIPQNDPFGGWVEWVHLQPGAIEQATVIRGGGAGQWGNSALAGVVRLDSRRSNDSLLKGDVRVGSKDSYAGNAQVSFGDSAGRLTATAHATETDGYFLLGRGQRGSADQKTARHSEGANLSWQAKTESGTIWSFAAGAGFDRFLNGAEEAEVKTDTYTVSVSALNEVAGSGPDWEVHAYARHKNFQSVFAAFDATRSASRPVLDQFDVPATGVGGNAVLRWTDVGAWVIETGVDLRLADGETNENFRNLGQGFTRQREAGGKQLVTGGFIEGHRQTTDKTIVTVGVRTDYWQQSSGMRRERDLADGRILIDREFANRNGVSVNGRAGIKSALNKTVSLRAAAYSGFRVPTLNELYRPFRVGNDITEANQDLVNERLVGAEISAQWQKENASADITVFRNDLFDPVLNTTITTVPGFNTDFGVFIPNGGSLRQRRNVDRVVTWGLEADVKLRVTDRFDLNLAYLFTDPEIRRSSVFPALEGNRLAQVAKHQGTVGGAFQASDRLRLSADLLFTSDQFEDDLNTRVLNGGATVDVQLQYTMTEHVELYAAAENLLDKRLQAGISSTGLVTLGPPVFLWFGLRLDY